MLHAHAHVMQVKLCKANTRGVTAPPPYKNLVPRFARLWQNLLNYRAHMHLSLSNDL